MQIAKIADILGIPTGNQLSSQEVSMHTLSLKTTLEGTTTAQREALDTTCGLTDRVETLADLQRDISNDVEINALLLVLKQLQKDSCHWVRIIIVRLVRSAHALFWRYLLILTFMSCYHPSAQLATSVDVSVLVCSEDTIRDLCYHWEALVISEEAEHELYLYMNEAEITANERLTDHITTQTTAEIMVKYFSSKC